MTYQRVLAMSPPDLRAPVETGKREMSAVTKADLGGERVRGAAHSDRFARCCR